MDGGLQAEEAVAVRGALVGLDAHEALEDALLGALGRPDRAVLEGAEAIGDRLDGEVEGGQVALHHLPRLDGAGRDAQLLRVQVDFEGAQPVEDLLQLGSVSVQSSLHRARPMVHLGQDLRAGHCTGSGKNLGPIWFVKILERYLFWRR